MLVFINHLDKNRYSINNHYGSSIEIGLLYEEYKNELEYQKLFEITSEIYKQYILQDKKLAEIYRKKKQNIWVYIFLEKGEHYRLIPLISKIINSKQFLEIGTFKRASAKALLMNSNIEKIYTFDLIPWHKFKSSFLNKEDFKKGRIVQIIDDLSKKNIFKKHQKLILESDFIFVDGPKNYNFEKIFLKELFTLLKRKNKSMFILIDDVKLSTMAKIWRSIPYPKIILDALLLGGFALYISKIKTYFGMKKVFKSNNYNKLY